jgi:soluble lytic murein transglycosylase-like protein
MRRPSLTLHPRIHPLGLARSAAVCAALSAALAASASAAFATTPQHARKPARAADHSPERMAERATIQRCLVEAGRAHNVPVPLLRAIAQQESGLRPLAVNRNTNGTSDLGLMQVNTRWLPVLARYGITREQLFDTCINARVGAWILAAAMRRHGDTWRAVGDYHSATPALNRRYAWAAYRRMVASADVPDGVPMN